MAGQQAQFDIILNIINKQKGKFKNELDNIGKTMKVIQKKGKVLNKSLSIDKDKLSSIKRAGVLEKEAILSSKGTMGEKRAAILKVNKAYSKQIYDQQNAIKKTQREIGLNNKSRQAVKKLMGDKKGSLKSLEKEYNKVTKNQEILRKTTESDAKKESRATQKSSEKKVSDMNREMNEREKVTNKSFKATKKAIQASTVLAAKEDGLRGAMKKTGLDVNKLTGGMSKMGYDQNKAGIFTNQLGDAFKYSRKNVKALRKSTTKFNMSALSGMFAMMALKRATGTFLRSAVNSYKKANEEGGAFTKETNKLSAAWEFFKISLLDALGNSDMFKALISVVVNLVNWFNKLKPSTKVILGLSLIFVFLAATIAMVIFQIQLFQSSSGAAAGAFGVAFLGVILILAGIIFIISGIVQAMKWWGKDTRLAVQGIIKIFIGLGLVVAGVALMMGLSMIAGIALIVVVIALAVLLIVKYWDKIEIGFHYMVYGLKVAWIAFKYFFIQIADKVVSYFINKFTGMMEKAAFLADKLGFDGVAERIRSGMEKISQAVASKAAQVQKDKQAELDAVKEVLDAKVSAIKKAEELRQKNIAAEKAGGSTSFIQDKMGIVDLTNKFGGNGIGTANTPTGVQSVVTNNNSANNYFQIDGGDNNPEEIGRIVVDMLDAQYGQSTGPSNI